MFSNGVRGSIGSSEYAFLQNLDKIHSTDTVEETPESLCLRCKTGDEVHHYLKQGNRISEQEGQSVGELFMTKRFETS